MLLLVALLPAVACRKESSPAATTRRVTTTTIPGDARDANVNSIIRFDQARFVDKLMLGTQRNADGTVAQEQTSFKSDEPIVLTFWIRESPAGLRTTAKWLDKNGKQLAVEQKEMNRGKVATFELHEKLKPGKYKVEAYWGGNFADSREFEVTAAQLKR